MVAEVMAVPSTVPSLGVMVQLTAWSLVNQVEVRMELLTPMAIPSTFQA